MINDMTHMFTSDPQVNPREGARLIEEMTHALANLKKDVLVAVSMRKPDPAYQKIVEPMCMKRLHFRGN